MLITNFAAGELAETLFGRIDLPQYYQGCSFLENFDVIPTGGISRRAGMKRLLNLGSGEGRIIPFTVDRETGFLLYLTPGKIEIIKNGVPQSAVNNSPLTPLYTSLGEIRDVQYAQNYDTMILAHGNYAPLAVKLTGGQLSVSLFEVSYRVRVNKTEDPGGGDDQTGEYDKISEKEYLLSAGNYPRCVTFFNGRLVFAGTGNNPQRIFASRVTDIDSDEQNIRNFSTYSLFQTEKREYITIRGIIQLGTNAVTITDSLDIGKFTRPFSDYHVQSPYYDEDTVAAAVMGDTLYLSKNTKDPGAGAVISQEQINFFLTWKANIDAADQWSAAYTVLYWPPDGYVKIYYRVGKYKIELRSGGRPVDELSDVLEYDLENVKKCATDKTYLYDQVFLKLQAAYYDVLYQEVDEESDLINMAVYAAFINDFYGYIKDKTQYALTLDGTVAVYYGTPASIYQQLLGNEGTGGDDGIDTILTLYTRDLIEDRYPVPDDGFTFEIASDMNDAIRWIGQNKNLLAGTETGEWIIPAGTNATNVQAILNSRYGSDTVQATSVGDAMCFLQTGRKALVEYYIPQQDNNFRAYNMAMLSKNMLRESPASGFDFISAPYTKIFVSREDGIVVSLLYERGTGTFAWGRIRTPGDIGSVAALPGQSGYDDVYLVVKRGASFFLEVLEERERVFLDSYRPLTAGEAANYTGDAVIYDATENRTYPKNKAPVAGHAMWIGYPYTSRIRSMPVIANDRMKPNAIRVLSVRFSDSYLPRTKSAPNNIEQSIFGEEPFSGIKRIPFPGGYERDVFFELIHDDPTRCQVLAVNMEVD